MAHNYHIHLEEIDQCPVRTKTQMHTNIYIPQFAAYQNKVVHSLTLYGLYTNGWVYRTTTNEPIAIVNRTCQIQHK